MPNLLGYFSSKAPSQSNYKLLSRPDENRFPECEEKAFNYARAESPAPNMPIVRIESLSWNHEKADKSAEYPGL
jgi:hypothetical protein